MQSTLEQIENSATADVKKTSDEFKTSRIHRTAVDLFECFGKVEQSDKIKCLISAAIDGLTCAEFDQALHSALEMAKTVDRSNGWQTNGKRGRGAYGPKASSFASRASERRQIFGVAKLNIETLVHLGPNNVYDPQMLPSYDAALNKARAYLSEHHLTWDGQNVERLQEYKRNQEKSREINEVSAEVRKAYPQKFGETIKAYFERIAGLVETALEKSKENKQKTQIDNIARKIIKDNGLGLSMDIADRIMSMIEEQSTQKAE